MFGMSDSDRHYVGIIGAGTMGAGIAQVAAINGWRVRLMDVDTDTVEHAIAGVVSRLNRLLEKKRITEQERDDAANRLHVANEPQAMEACELLIEAVVERLDVKTEVIGSLLPHVPDDCIIASNTSSLSIGAIGEAIGRPRQTVGMHFFNPAPLMKLVEVIAGAQTDAAVVDRTAAIAESWGKKVARAADVPGFIVNHVARPYYLEAFRILEDGYASVDEIDHAMKSLGGFRMGPFELTDLIGQDVNTATTRSVWEQLGHPPLLHPNAVQERLVSSGALGRKTKRGAYDYSGETPAPAIDIDPRELTMDDQLIAAVRGFCENVTDQSGDNVQQFIFARIVGAIIVQAALAVERGVAERTHIDTALKYGVNYPKGPFEWADQIGINRVAILLAELNRAAPDDRFAIPESLRVTA